MTEITKILSDEETQFFEILLYGEDYCSGIYSTLPAGLTFDDTAIECISCLVLLKQRNSLPIQRTNELFELYSKMLEHIEVKHPDLKLDGSIFTESGFKEFLNRYPQIRKALC